MGCGASSEMTVPISPVAAPAKRVMISDASNVVQANAEASPKPEIKGIVAPAAEEDSMVLPGSVPEDKSTKSAKKEKKKKKKSNEEDLTRSSAPLKSRPGSAGGGRPSSAERVRPGSAGGKDEVKDKDRPGSAGRNRDDKLKPAVWLADKRKMGMGNIKDLESKLDKDIFKNKGSPMKSAKKQAKSAKKAAREDPGPLRPTTAKRREGRPSSAERNRDEAVKPSVWLESVSREVKSGSRSFINCNPTEKAPENKDRPSSADRNRKKEKKKDNNGQLLDQNGMPMSKKIELGELKKTPKRLSKLDAPKRGVVGMSAEI